MINKTNKPGYVLVLSLTLIALTVAIITALTDKGRVHVKYLKTMIDREKAKALAWSGVQIAISQIAHAVDEAKPEKLDMEDNLSKKNVVKKVDLTEQAKRILINLLPVVNSWQTFDLSLKNDGIKGQIKICISSEEGKIDLNQIFDFSKKKFVNEGEKEKDYKKYMKEVCDRIKKAIGGKSLFVPLEKFLKDRQNKLYDPTELLKIDQFDKFKEKIFYIPSPFIEDETAKEGQTIYLNDVFTLWSFQKELNPWFLSHSLKILLGLKGNLEEDSRLKSKNLKEKLKNFSLDFKVPGDWDTMLASIYGKKFDQLPKEIRSSISAKFEPNVFSVLSYGTVGGVTQKLLVILERKKSSRTDLTGQDGTSFEFSTKKFYWL